MKGTEKSNTRRRTPTGDAVRQLMRNKASVVSMIVILIMLFIAIFADTIVFTIFTGEKAVPLLAPYHYATVDFVNTNAPAFTPAPDGGMGCADVPTGPINTLLRNTIRSSGPSQRSAGVLPL